MIGKVCTLEESEQGTKAAGGAVHLKHFTHKIEFLPTPFLQTPHGCSPESSL